MTKIRNYIYLWVLHSELSLELIGPQAVRKVLARLKYSVPLSKAESGFAIVTEECLTFRTVSPAFGVALPHSAGTYKDKDCRHLPENCLAQPHKNKAEDNLADDALLFRPSWQTTI